MYVVGEGPNAIIWNYDVYGFDAGMDSRTSLGRPEPGLQSFDKVALANIVTFSLKMDFSLFYLIISEAKFGQLKEKFSESVDFWQVESLENFRQTIKDGGEIDAEEIVKFSCKHTNWDNIKYDLDEKIIPFLRSRGATKFGTIGTCWGGYNIIRFLYLHKL